MQIITYALRRLWRKRTRSLLTMSGIVIGVALVALVSAISAAGRTAVTTELENMGLSGLSVTAGDQASLDADALLALRQLEQVNTAVPLMVESSVAFTPRGESTSLMVCGIDSGEVQAIGLTTLHGRMLSVADVAASASVCVVDTAVANELFGRENVLGCTVGLSLGGVEEAFTVVGVTQAGSTLLQNVSRWIPGMVYVPYTTVQQLTGRVTFDQFAVTLRDSTASAEGVHAVVGELAKWGSDFHTDDLSAQKDKLTAVMNAVVWVLTAIGGVSLLVAGLSIMTIMTVAVGERTREIGIKKAIGATNRRILLEFLCEALLLSLSGGVVGVLLGGGIGAIGLSLFGMPTVAFHSMLWLIGFSGAIGMLFGVVPAWKAARLDPVEALRCE